MVSMYPKAEILFPPKLIPTLQDLRGPEWAELVGEVSRLPEMHPDVLAFCMMMIQLDGCLNCYAGSYKFMRGCAACARQTIAQYKGGDDELLRHFQKARQEVQAYLSGSAVIDFIIEEEEEPMVKVEDEEEKEEEEEDYDYEDETGDEDEEYEEEELEEDE